MTDVLHMLLGALLVTFGVLASALADRIRQLRATRQDGDRVTVARVKNLKNANAPSDSDDVIAALVAAGYRKGPAARAAAACSPQEQATPELWIAAALRRCAQGGAS